MKLVETEVLSEEINFVVVRTPGRKFPGIVIQGDSLASIYVLVNELVAVNDKPRNPDLSQELARQLQSELGSRVEHYERVLGEHNLPLPYGQRFFGTK